MGGEREVLLKGMRWGWDRKFLVNYWVRTFPSVIMKNVSAFSEEGGGVPHKTSNSPTISDFRHSQKPLLLDVRLFSFKLIN